MLTVWVPVLFPTRVGGDRIGMLRAGLDSPGALTRLHAAPLVVNDRVSPALLDSPSAATNTNGSSVDPLSCRVSPDRVTVSCGAFWLFVSWYRIGLPGISLKALLPNAAPLHEGTATENMLSPAALPGVILRLKVR